jgi:hypothetical protein
VQVGPKYLQDSNDDRGSIRQQNQKPSGSGNSTSQPLQIPVDYIFELGSNFLVIEGVKSGFSY